MEATKTNIFFERHTIRKYLDKPVSKELLIEVLRDATRAPSWANSQPWEVYVAAGKTLEELRKAYLESFENNEPHTQELPTPKGWPEYIDKRMKKSFAESFNSMGIIRDDEVARYKNWKNNYQFFGAPVAAFLCLDTSLADWSLFDLGMFANSLMLSAKAHGLDSAPAASSVSYPHHIRKILEIPENQKIIVGIMMGYADLEHPYNQYVSSRTPVEEVVHFRGM
jgi:nitroreductase